VANKEFQQPIMGINYGFPVDKTPKSYSGYMNNVFPRDVLERRIRLGQRPGVDKVFEDNIGNSYSPVMALIQIKYVS